MLSALLACNYCRKEKYDTALNYDLQNFAGAIWQWGLADFDGNKCAFGSNCTGFL